MLERPTGALCVSMARPAIPRIIVLAWLSLHLLVGHATARSDVVAQFYSQYQKGGKLPSIPFLPDPFPESITKRLKGMAFSELSIHLQHALLWDAGFVASGDTDRQKYVQIKVNSGSTMDDIFLTRDTISDKADCGLVTCNAQILHFAFANCSLAQVEPQTKCAIFDDQPVKAISGNPVWLEDGEIDTEPNFQVFLKEQSGSTSGSSKTKMYIIQEKPNFKLTDDRVSCPNKASFIIPCRQLSSSDSQAVANWPDPSPGVLVDLWIAQEFGSRQIQTSEKSKDTTSSIFKILFAVACVICFALAICLWRKRKYVKRTPSSGSGGGRSGGSGGTGGSGGGPGGGAGGAYQDHHQVLISQQTAHHPNNTTDSENTANGFHNPNDRPSFTNAELEKINANFCDRSLDLAHFCGDQELMMKRISYASLHFATLVARGANGEVWRGEYASQEVAIKRMLRDKQGEIMSMEVFAREIRLASTLEHPNIVRFIGLSWRSLSELCMVSEFMPTGDLAHYLLSKESRNLTWKHEKMALALDICNALVYLHSLMPVIIHRDLKSLNVLLNSNLEAKLSDFGLSRERSFEETMTSGVGTMLWTAPEVLRGDRYSEKADIYSYGVVLSELDTCLPPYSLNEQVARAKQKSAQLLPLIRNGQIKPQFRASVPKGIQELAASCLDFLPEKRPNAMQIVYILRSKVLPTLV